MPRKSNALLELEAQEKAEEIAKKAEERVMAMLPGLVGSITGEIMAKMGMTPGATPIAAATVGPVGASTQDPALLQMIKSVAVDFARLADPKNERQLVAPEVAASRAAGKEELLSLLAEAIKVYHETKQAPVYVLINKIFVEGIKIEPQQENATTKRMEDVEINWVKIPNQAMRPVNESAQKIHAAYMKMISNGMGQLTAPPAGAFVLTGNRIRRHGVNYDPPETGSPVVRANMDARQRKEIPILGSLISPAVETV